MTPELEQKIGYLARVSNLSASSDDPAEKLIRYLIEHKHWSPFEMANMCVEVNAPRDVTRQLLRHRSFTFQEFSGRYAEYPDLLGEREVRLLDPKNRQNSFDCDDPSLQTKWNELVQAVRNTSLLRYRAALDLGVAKEVARALLPEGLVPTRMYVNGTIRSWIHYCDIRTGPETQKEHREIANQVKAILIENAPTITKALGW